MIKQIRVIDLPAWKIIQLGPKGYMDVLEHAGGFLKEEITTILAKMRYLHQID